jgi:secreted trypsin-like serine protease
MLPAPCRYSMLVLCLAAHGCRTTSSSDSQIKMVGGQPLTADNPGNASAIALTDGDHNIFCSGTLVSSDLVVTAAHCVKDSPKFIDFVNAANSSPEYRPVTETLSGKACCESRSFMSPGWRSA